MRMEVLTLSDALSGAHLWKSWEQMLAHHGQASVIGTEGEKDILRLPEGVKAMYT